jgi:hypothetical protein
MNLWLIQSLDIATILAAIATIIALSDFFLTPDQRAQVQSHVESLALRMSYVTTAKLMLGWVRARAILV